MAKREPRFARERLSAETVDVRTLAGGKVAVSRLVLDDKEVIWTALGEKSLPEMLEMWTDTVAALDRLQENILIGELTHPQPPKGNARVSAAS